MIGEMSKKPPNAVGTYGFLVALLIPSRTRSTPGESARDIEAIRSGEERRVACHLRGAGDHYPEKLKQGSLDLGKGRAIGLRFGASNGNGWISTLT
jgi:hypothetical protein